MFGMSSRRIWLLIAHLLPLSHSFVIPRSVIQARQVDPSDLLDEYDYVIVGGGTAGLTVADRLTEDQDITVLVIESGRFVSDRDALPVLGGGTGRQPRYRYQSVPQTNLKGKTFTVELGNMVGGSSGVNAMMSLRGSAEDYDRWGQLFDEDEQNWNWEGILPFFKKAIKFTPPDKDLAKRFNISFDTSYWGDESALQTSFPSFQFPGLDPLVSAFYELPNVEEGTDSGAGGAGVYWFPTLMDPLRHERSYAYNAHYENLDRPNYHLLAEARVRRVHFDDGKTATSVEFVKSSATMNITASKEIIISAGAVHTPQLLQVSGIGPKDVVEAAGFKSLVDLPGVGQNFQDHSRIATSISLPGLKNIHPNSNDLQNDAKFRKMAGDLWNANRTGPYSIAYGNIAGWLPMTAVSPDSFESLADELENQDHASYLADGTDQTVAKGYAKQMAGLANAMRSKDTVFTRYYINATTGAGKPILNQPFSRGSININPNDPWGTPVVDYRSLSNPMERKVMVEMVKFYRRYHFNTSLKNLGPVESAPGSSVTSDDDIAAWVSSAAEPSDYHPAGTAAMMPLEIGGVVDQTLRVYGVKSLRIIDASIMPNLPGGNTCQPTYALAEKAVDIIKRGV